MDETELRKPPTLSLLTLALLLGTLVLLGTLWQYGARATQKEEVA